MTSGRLIRTQGRAVLRGFACGVGCGYGLHGMGQDGGDGTDGGGGFDTGGISIDPSTIPGYTPPGQDIIPVAPDTATPAPLPYQDVTAGLPPGSIMNYDTGTVVLPDGSSFYSDGSYYVAATDSYYDANGNLLSQGGVATGVPSSSQAAAAAQSGGASIPGGGGKGGGGSGSGSSSGLAQMLACLLNPNSPGCRGQQTATGGVTRPGTTSSSVSSFLSKYGGWILAFAGLVFVLPAVLPSSGRR